MFRINVLQAANLDAREHAVAVYPVEFYLNFAVGVLHHIAVADGLQISAVFGWGKGALYGAPAYADVESAECHGIVGCTGVEQICLRLMLVRGVAEQQLHLVGASWGIDAVAVGVNHRCLVHRAVDGACHGLGGAGDVAACVAPAAGLVLVVGKPR